MLQAKAFVVSGMLFLVFLLVSCAAPPSGSPVETAPLTSVPTPEATVAETPITQEPAAIAEERTLITLVLPFENPEVMKAVEILNSAETTSYKLEVSVLPTYQEKLMNLFAAGAAPDLIWMDPYLLPSFAAQDLLVDITERLGETHEAEKVDDYFPMVFNSFTYQGRQYGLPWRSAPIMLYVNTAHLEEAGLDADVNNWDWQLFLDTCVKLTNKANNQYGFVVNFWSLPIWSWQGGGDTAFYQTMIDVLMNKRDCTPEDEVVDAAGGLRAMLENGNVYMMMDVASYAIEEINSAITAFPLPKGPNNQDTSAYISGLSINKNTAQPDIAYQAFLDLVWTVQTLEAYTPRISLADNTAEWKAKIAGQAKLDASSDNINTNLHLMNVPVPHSIVWVPYPPGLTPPIGQADLVPGAPPMVAGVNQLEAVLSAGQTRINVARTVRLEDGIGVSYLAPPDRDIAALSDRARFEEQARNQGVIIGAAVIEKESEAGISPGAYALRVRLEGDKWFIEYIGANSSEPVFTRDIQPRPYAPDGSDTYPSAALVIGSRNGDICIPWLEWCFSGIPL